MKTQELLLAFESFAPCYLANDWDNVGLLVGSTDWPADSILLTIDLTEAVLQEAIDTKIDAIVSYHPRSSPVASKSLERLLESAVVRTLWG